MLNPQSTFNETAAFRTETMIGENRHTLLNRVKQAINQTHESEIYFFVGDGGIGKTRLLQEIGNQVNFCNQPTAYDPHS
ncbi:MAG: hypothetical protein KC445_07315 [Anaerolineales bacterium]|nr:hypothetical protein [Anaerolineales bacterium]